MYTENGVTVDLAEIHRIIEEADVEAVVGDAAEMALDRIVLAAGFGRTSEAAIECDRIIASGESAQSVIAALQRHFLRLHRMRSGYDGGNSLEEVMRSLRPPAHFRQRPALEQQCRQWKLTPLNAALGLIGDAAKAARLQSGLEGTMAEKLLLDLGALAKQNKAAERS